MAPQRTLEDHGVFDVIGASRDLKCRACSKYLTYDKIIKPKTKSHHLQSVTHQRAVQHLGMDKASELPKPAPASGTYISAATWFSKGMSDDEETHERAAFGNLTFHKGDVYDENNMKIILSAGASADDGAAEACEHIKRLLDGKDPILLPDEPTDDLWDQIQGSDQDEQDEPYMGDDSEDPRWFPYSSKTLFFLDLLDNLPRLRLSDDHMRAILWVMKECGTPSVPSFYGLRKAQEKLRTGFLEARKHESVSGNQFFTIDPVDTVCLDWGNPHVRRHLHVYPEVTGPVSEFWQAGKYTTEVPDEQLTPMWADWSRRSSSHYYVKEVAQLQTGEFILPLRWVVYHGEEHAHAVLLSEVRPGEYELHDPEKRYIPCRKMSRNFLDLNTEHPNLTLHDNPMLVALGINGASLKPHPVRAIANGRPAFCIRLVPWADDVSGNRSKQYNPHMNVYFTNANIPHSLRAQEFYIHFTSTSPEASALDQLDAFLKSLQKAEWHETYDCQLKREIIFQVHAHLFSGDNPMQAEVASNTGANSRMWCRSDKSGGTKEERETDDGYHALYQPAEPRRPQETIEVIMSQLYAAATGVQKSVDTITTATGVKDRIAASWVPKLMKMATDAQRDRIELEATRDPRLNKKMTKREQKVVRDIIKVEIQQDVIQWLITQPPKRFAELPEDSEQRNNLRSGDHFSVFLGLPGFDPHADMPCEILHTILLGIDKYLWYETTNKWTPRKDHEFAALLEDLSIDGLSIRSFRPRAILQFKNSLIGRQFKSLQQLSIFSLRAYSTSGSEKERQLYQLWKATGELGALLWFPEIQDMDQYLDDLDIAVSNVLDAWGCFDPSRIQYKYKLHILAHLRRDIARFGPAILFSTETFEAWNSIFRTCSILSNHLSPSRDIAETLAGMERVKHYVSGGWWKFQGEYVRAGTGVREYFNNDQNIRRRLGLNLEFIESEVPGMVKPVSKASQKPKKLVDHTSYLLGEVSWHVDTSIAPRDFIECEALVAQSKDSCKPLSFVFYQLHPDSSIQIGRISKILSISQDPTTSGVAVIDRYDVSMVKHPQLGMPVLTRIHHYDIVPSKTVLFIFNAQCEPSSSGQTPEVPPTDPQFVINMHALHNAHRIRSALPRELTRPVPLYDNMERRQKHNDWAKALRVTGPAKRQATKEKAAATRLKNKGAVGQILDAPLTGIVDTSQVTVS